MKRIRSRESGLSAGKTAGTSLISSGVFGGIWTRYSAESDCVGAADMTRSWKQGIPWTSGGFYWPIKTKTIAVVCGDEIAGRGLAGVQDCEKHIVSTRCFQAQGLWGRLYWYMVLPFHAFVFRGMINALVRK